MFRKEAMKDSSIWQNIGEVAVQTSNFELSVHLYALLRIKACFPFGELALRLV